MLPRGLNLECHHVPLSPGGGGRAGRRLALSWSPGNADPSLSGSSPASQPASSLQVGQGAQCRPPRAPRPMPWQPPLLLSREAVGVGPRWPVLQPLTGASSFAAKAGYCYNVPPLANVFDTKDCSACQKNGTCSACSGDAQCPGAQKCCPGDCGYVCQEAIFGKGKVFWRALPPPPPAGLFFSGVGVRVGLRPCPLLSLVFSDIKDSGMYFFTSDRFLLEESHTIP